MAVAQRAASPAGPEGPVLNPYSVLPNWLYPAFVATGLGLFTVYALWVVLFQRTGEFGNYLSPFYSPFIWKTGPVPPAVWITWAPLAFRGTCYYYRKAYFRAFFWHPRSCAVGEPKGRGQKYKGETAFPWILNNFHRFAFYVTAVQVGFLWWDVIQGFNCGGRFGGGVGTVILLVNTLMLSGYTFGCHAFRHLAGGGVDCFSCSKARYRLWKGVTVLNVRHDRWAWASLFTVILADLYIRLLILHVIPFDPRWIA